MISMKLPKKESDAMELGEDVARKQYGTRRDVDLNEFNPYPDFAWKVARPIVFEGYEHISQYFAETLLDFPIFFRDLPDTVDDPYYPSYAYTPVEGPDMGDFMKIYKNIEKIIEINFEKCKEYSQSCELWAEGMRSHATDACCGFTAPVFSVFLHEANKFDVDDIISKQKHIEISEKAVLYYREIVGYGKRNEEFSWNSRCQGWKNELMQNVNLLSFYYNPIMGFDGNMTCGTSHHFVVFIHAAKPEFSFIIDAWAGKGGRRGKWIRIMYTEHLNAVLNAISISTDERETNILINQYFAVPNSAIHPTMDLITKKMFVGNIALDHEESRIEHLHQVESERHRSAKSKSKSKSKGKGKGMNKSRKIKGKSKARKGKRSTR